MIPSVCFQADGGVERNIHRWKEKKGKEKLGWLVVLIQKKLISLLFSFSVYHKSNLSLSIMIFIHNFEVTSMIIQTHFILYLNWLYYQIESCRLERIDCRPSHYHLQKFTSRMSLTNNHLWTVFLLRHCPTNDAILYIRCELLSRVIQSIQTLGNHS